MIITEAEYYEAEAAFKSGHYTLAEEKCRQYLQILSGSDRTINTEERILLANFSRLLADVFVQLHKTSEALPYAEQSLQIGREVQNTNIEARAHRILGVIHGERADFKKAMECFHQALSMYEASTRKDGVSLTLSNIGLVYQMQSNYPMSLQYLNQALAMDEELGSDEGIARNLGNIGTVYAYLSEYPNALEKFQKALEITERLGLKRSIAINLSNIGSIYQVLSDYPRAEECFHQALALHSELNQKDGIAFALGNIGVIKHAQSQHESALEYYRKALAINEEIGNTYLITINLANIGAVYEFQKQHAPALEMYQRALEMNQQLGIELGTAVNYGNIGDIYSKNDPLVFNPILAEEYLLKAVHQLKQIGSKKEYYEFLLSLSHLYASLCRWEEAYDYHRQFYEIKEEIQNESISIQAQRFAIERDMMVIKREQEIVLQKNTELAAINTQLEQSNHELSMLNSTLEDALKEITLVQAELIRTEREASLANIELSQKNDALHQLNIEKNEFLGIASHDLKNPLSSIILIANMLEYDATTLTPSEIRVQAGEIRTTAKRMFDLIVNLLDVNKIEQGTLLAGTEVFSAGQCTANVIHHHASKAAQKNITITSTADDTLIDTSPMAFIQVLDNLLSNAIKFSPMGSEIQVHTRRTPDNRLRLSIRDQGPGLTAEDHAKLFGRFVRLSARPTGGENSTGLGLSIVKKIVEAMNGSIWCESEAGKGAEFIAEFPSIVESNQADTMPDTDTVNHGK